MQCIAGDEVDSCTAGNPAAEICDGLDNDCDGTLPTDEYDIDEDSYLVCEGDCNDDSADIFPGNPERDDDINQNCVNDGPRIISKPVTTLVEEDPYVFKTKYKYDVNAVDPEGDILTYSLLEAPVGMAINANTGLIEWIPTKSQLGANKVRVEARDTDGLTDVQAFTISVGLPKKETYAREKIGWTQLELLNGDELKAGDDLLALITFTNKDIYNMDHTRITLTIQDLDLRNRIGPFRVDAGDSITQMVPLEIPYDVEPGVYTLRVSVANDGITRIKYRDIFIK